MKKMIIIACSIFLFALPYNLKAQEDKSTTQHVKEGVKKGAKGVKKGVTKGANEVAQQASEMKADVTDHEVETKMGPGGEDVFIDDNGRYYYIDGKGHRVYKQASQLKNKPAKVK